ncbi:transcriptional regulator [Kosakonia sp. HypNH10]|uniref:winged helix-turn-helix domain-containing protein n=1 Tax=Kosakonia sp. HypNH10 TaxID=2980101 RepID=UPI00244D0B2F|nr:transcriptional regulator [Kosakonia sp. HypNH10]MDH2911417.1 transcriptional regulator [Kosakonia sp. HypNH10]
MHWIINEYIEFRPVLKKLTSLKNPEVSVILTTPASRCLLLLLEASPEIVLQQDFFKKVWEEEGMLVPANTLYQNISIVRRGLRAVGDTDQKLIATIPRKGFQIDDGVRIIKQDDIVRTDNKIELPTLDVPSPALPERSVVSEDVDASPEPGLPPASQPLPGEDDNRIKKLLLPLLLVLISFVTGFIVTSFIWYKHAEPAFFNTYTLTETDSGCHLHTRNDIHDNNNPYSKYKTLILNTGLSCKSYPWVYFPLSVTSPTLTALACKKKYTTESSPGCISLHITGINRDD